MYVQIGRYADEDDSENFERQEHVVIHKYDTWSMDHTLALIVEPMLKQLKATKHGAPNVDIEDTPEHLHPPEDWYETKYKHNGETDEHFFERWDWVLDEMIWAFEQKNLDDWDEQYWEEHPEFDWDGEPDEDGFVEVKTIKHGKCDWEGRKAHQERMSNGFRLFGKYFESLWD